MGTLKQFFMEIQGYKLIPEDYVVLIECDGQSVRLEGPSGYVRPNVLSERFGPMIRTGFYYTRLVSENVRSADGVPFNIHAKISYYFNPIQCDKKVGFELVRGGAEAVHEIAQDYGDQAIRHAVGDFTTDELRSGKTLEQLKRKIWRRLFFDLSPFGIIVPQAGNVAITHISPPNNLEKALEVAKQQKVMADALNAMPPKVLDQMITTGILEKLTANGSSTQFISSLADLPSLSRCLLGQDVPTSTNGHQNSKSRLPNQ